MIKGLLHQDLLQDTKAYSALLRPGLKFLAAAPKLLPFAHYAPVDLLAERLPPPANLIVSNVRGPAAPLYMAGTRLDELYSVGPILDGLGLNATAWAYANSPTFTILADHAAVPDGHALTAELNATRTELRLHVR